MKFTSNNSAPFRSLILAGGGARLAYQAGVIKALEEEGLKFNHVDGTSGGIFNTAMLCSGIKPAEMALRWRRIKPIQFSSLLPLRSYFSRKKFSALGDADAIINKIFPTLGIDITRINANEHIDATFNVCNFSEKTVQVFTNKNVTLKHLVAGMSLPIFMPAIKINNTWFTDAVWIKDANLNEAVKRSAREIWLIWAIGNTSEFFNGVFNQYVHMIEISANGGLILELEQIESLNKTKHDSEKIILHVIKPEFPLPLDPDLILNKINVDELINRGYADAKKYLQIRNREGVEINYKATQMHDPGVALNFRSCFKGVCLSNSRKIEVSINISFHFHLINNKLQPVAYSSVAFEENELRISTYNNSIKVEHNRLFFDADFILENEQCHLNIETKLNSSIDLMLGLEFKKATCIISGKQFDSENKFVLIQTAWSRIKNILFIHISSHSGWYKRQKEKMKILRMAFNKLS